MRLERSLPVIRRLARFVGAEGTCASFPTLNSMLPTPNFTASSLPVSGTITRAGADAPFTHGFGTLLQQEHDLQTCTADSVGAVTGPNAPALTRMLRYQQTRIGANITLLQQR